jgi:hypothetical protein
VDCSIAGEMKGLNLVEIPGYCGGIAAIFSTKRVNQTNREDGAIFLQQNTGEYLPDYTESH